MNNQKTLHHKALSWDWAESNTQENQVIRAARETAVELGAHPVSPATGAALRMLAAVSGARATIEIGTGAGVSGLYLLEGLPSGGVLTTIDCEAEYQQAARGAFREAGIANGTTRLINGYALDILPRMTPAAYDLVVIDADEREILAYLEQAARVLRPGGTVALVHALWYDQVADPARRENDTVAVRQALNSLMSDERFIANLLTCGDGLAVGVLR